MIIIIPLGGLGERFKRCNYTKPKPLISVKGKPIIFWLLDSIIKSEYFSTVKMIIIPYNSDLQKYDFEGQLRTRYSNINFCFLSLSPTRGPVESIYTILKTVNIDDNIMSIDGDTFYNIDIIKQYHNNPIKNVIFYFNDINTNAIYSYIDLENNQVKNIKEKIKISDNACSGIYCFESRKLLLESCEYIMKNKSPEWYLSFIIDYLVSKSKLFVGIKINDSDFTCLGTPAQLQLFYHMDTNKNFKDMRVCFDLDGTLVTTPSTIGDYSTVNPIKHMIDYARYLKQYGATIIIYTARRMRTHNENSGKAFADAGKDIFSTLEKFGIPCDEFYIKPYADWYIDDKAVNSFGEYEKDLGIYLTDCPSRSFNNIESLTTTIKKSSNDMKGEIFYYNNIPNEVKNLFPKIYEYDDKDFKWLTMEKIPGITFSKLYISGDMTNDHLLKLLNIIEKLHTIVPYYEIDKQNNIYDNYCPKMNERLTLIDTSKFENFDNIYNEVYNYLNKYTKNNKGFISIIHGDPVFSNIILSNNNIKLIDVRGKVGKNYTIYGDVNYDLAKIYQSLLGYDEILLNTYVKDDYKQGLIKYFEEHIIRLYGKNILDDIKMITKSLILSLLPLHPDKNQILYYRLISC